ncbi:hypothetical protein RR48_00557 [Papilio machaon]|uniref:Uncharacterized protein n=1 Tax=Papilio machaon TaxID=76193 RepID=A0A0N0PFB4_PAPMA|nr:hypothetical protein RR48_00557 [Papilio machaon]
MVVRAQILVTSWTRDGRQGHKFLSRAGLVMVVRAQILVTSWTRDRSSRG